MWGQHRFTSIPGRLRHRAPGGLIYAAVRHLYERRAQAAVQARGPLVAHDGGERPADAGVVGRRRLRRQPGPQQVQRVRLQVGKQLVVEGCYNPRYRDIVSLHSAGQLRRSDWSDARQREANEAQHGPTDRSRIVTLTCRGGSTLCQSRLTQTCGAGQCAVAT